ncbi:putative PH domain-containing protein [Escovopsis weberi]|uniref:Putative PH domain-containing protein n=1 Tax=Escovopsis weberi TaxID=150374 RepID=A0A0M8N017_ESCWE|nr:putative PH domain-containing protein [Escovopsis weberi]
MALGSWTAFLVAYLLGGITFVPALVAAFFAYAYFAFPRRSDLASPAHDGLGHPDIVLPGDDTAPLDAARADVKPPTNQDVDVTSGYFAVYREYNPAGINAKPVERPAPVASTTIAAPSPSVYQTMYRSIFDRKPAAGPLDTNNNRMAQRPKKAGNVFYVVLRHGHLMLFDDEEQLEVRHVISLALHDISIYSGEEVTPEGELFIKRNAICLSRRREASPTSSSSSSFSSSSAAAAVAATAAASASAASDRPADGQTSKPFFMFSENCSAKEDFYFALLKNQQQALGFDNLGPKPKQFELKSLISLVQKLHSTEDQVHARWLNALIGRLFLGIYRTSDLSNIISEKITKKIARVKKPSFLTNIKIQKIETGDSAPYFSGLRLRDLTIEGECVVEADVKYNGNFRIEVAATAKLDLGTRFKAREVNLVLAVVLRRLEGHLLFRVKAPPSNRIWFSFQTMPKLEMAIEPIVSSRQITYTVITRQIENRIKEVLAETLVQPFWDDVPFFKTEHKKWRGGIFENDDAVEVSRMTDETAAAIAGNVDATEALDAKRGDLEDLAPIEKSQSVPVPEAHQPRPGLTGRKGRFGESPAATVSSTSVDVTPSGPGGASSPPSLKSQTGSLSRNFFLKRENANALAAAAEAEPSSSSQSQSQSQSQKKNNTFTAVTNAANQARQWGWNALQRQRDAMRHTDKASVFDLSQPMGRGQPLPPPGTPLPGPNNTGRTKVMPIPTPKQGHGTHRDFGSAEHDDPTAQGFANNNSRRRRGNSHQDESDEKNILVVAAPDDSEPGTPGTDHTPDPMDPWAGDPAPESQSQSHTGKSPPREKPGTPTMPPRMTKTERPSPSRKRGPSKSGATAAANASIDDDDYSGWMSDINLEEEVVHQEE